MPEYYEFTTVWRFDAPIERVWKEIKNSETWSEWWKGVLKVEELKSGETEGVGKIVRSIWKSALPYNLIFDSEIIRVEHLKLIEARAFGELEGAGCNRFEFNYNKRFDHFRQHIESGSCENKSGKCRNRNSRGHNLSVEE